MTIGHRTQLYTTRVKMTIAEHSNYRHNYEHSTSI